jgi:hypothetical protein
VLLLFFNRKKKWKFRYSFRKWPPLLHPFTWLFVRELSPQQPTAEASSSSSSSAGAHCRVKFNSRKNLCTVSELKKEKAVLCMCMCDPPLWLDFSTKQSRVPPFYSLETKRCRCQFNGTVSPRSHPIYLTIIWKKIIKIKNFSVEDVHKRIIKYDGISKINDKRKKKNYLVPPTIR